MTNNSDQAAMHDELRALIAEMRAVPQYAELFGDTVHAWAERLAALSMPVGEAVRDADMARALVWVRDQACSEFEREYVASIEEAVAAYDPARVGARTAQRTPQPAPAAHAGGEAVAVDALRAYIADLREQAKKLRNEIPNLRDGTDKRFDSARDAELVADELTALLSGGAAREDKS